jgi:uncharacterized membrane protein
MENANPPALAAVQKSYVWLALGFFMPVFAFYGIYTIFQNRDAAKGSWLESHTDYQVRLVSVVAVLLAVGIVLGMLHINILSLALFCFMFIWYMLRIAKGMFQLGDGEPAAQGWV